MGRTIEKARNRQRVTRREEKPASGQQQSSSLGRCRRLLRGMGEVIRKRREEPVRVQPGPAEGKKQKVSVPPSVIAYEENNGNGYKLVIRNLALRNAINKRLSEPQPPPATDHEKGVTDHPTLLTRKSLILRGDVLIGRGKDGLPSPIPSSDIKRLRRELAEIHSDEEKPSWQFHFNLGRARPTKTFNH